MISNKTKGLRIKIYQLIQTRKSQPGTEDLNEITAHSKN